MEKVTGTYVFTQRRFGIRFGKNMWRSSHCTYSHWKQKEIFSPFLMHILVHKMQILHTKIHVKKKTPCEASLIVHRAKAPWSPCKICKAGISYAVFVVVNAVFWAKHNMDSKRSMKERLMLLLSLVITPTSVFFCDRRIFWRPQAQHHVLVAASPSIPPIAMLLALCTVLE